VLITRAFDEYGWTGFEVEFNELYPTDEPASLEKKALLLRANRFSTRGLDQLARLFEAVGTSDEDAISEIASEQKSSAHGSRRPS
jgi:hypothetical protein